MKWLSPLCLVLLIGCSSQPKESAFVSVAGNAQAGDMRILAIDGEKIQQVGGVHLSPGDHEISVACKLSNGISMSFEFNVELLPSHSYCFYSRDQGKACTILYAQHEWNGGGPSGCR